MKKIFCKVALCFVALGFVACDAAGNANAPIEVQYRERDNSMWQGLKVREIRITALEDVEILKVIPNRGNCEATGMSVENWRYGSVPNVHIGQEKTLMYGETWDLTLSNNCSRLLEVKVVTDKGEFEFKF